MVTGLWPWREILQVECFDNKTPQIEVRTNPHIEMKKRETWVGGYDFVMTNHQFGFVTYDRGTRYVGPRIG